MPEKFSFESAIGWVFKAPHANPFIWQFAIAYGLVVTGLSALGLSLIRDVLQNTFDKIVALENSNADDAVVMEAIFGMMRDTLPYVGLAVLVFWVVWSIFQTASLRRLVWGQNFSLGFGRDELNIMVVSFLNFLLSLAFFAIPGFIIWGAISEMINGDYIGLSDDEVFEMMAGSLLGGFGVLFLAFPFYVFVATRIAPCFGLTMKEGEVRFFDAWNVSRGRFWPILGAYLILAICIGIAVSVVDNILQFAMMPALISGFENASDPEDILGVIFSGSSLIVLSIYIFLSQVMAALQMHAIHAPAAYAARHDPRGGIADDQRVAVFE